MITRKQIKRDLSEDIGQCYGFTYKGKDCGIDPIDDYFEMWYGDTDCIVSGIDEVLSVGLYDGKSLDEILPDITEYGVR